MSRGILEKRAGVRVYEAKNVRSGFREAPTKRKGLRLAETKRMFADAFDRWLERHPELKPRGHFVAYGNGPKQVTAESVARAYLALDGDKRGLLKRMSADAAIPYAVVWRAMLSIKAARKARREEFSQ
jgi:hypothetical protein